MNHKAFGLIGKKLGHSFSATYFNSKFQQMGLTYSYSLFELEEISDLPGLLRQHPEIAGLNVTIPYKQAVIPYLDELDPVAQEVGAVNTIQVRDGRLKGFNTDVIGFGRTLHAWMNPVQGGAIILGAGGASRAVEYVLALAGMNPVVKVSRKPRHAGEISWEAFQQLDMTRYRLLVNTTPLGMSPDTRSFAPTPFAALGPGHYCYDLVYNPEETAWLRRCKEAGAQVLNGMGMLTGQAEAAWEIWNA